MSPDLSVIVTIGDGGRSLAKCLEAITTQQGGLEIEVIVPFDVHLDPGQAVRSDHPQVRFVDITEATRSIGHTTFDDRKDFWEIARAEGIRHAKAEFVAFLHDQVVPHPGWAEAMLVLHRENRVGAVGGTVTNGTDSGWNWGVHFFDFARYSPPVDTGPTPFISAKNACYRMELLAPLERRYETGFKDLLIHEELASSTGMLLSDLPRATEYRKRTSWSDLGNEWRTWGKRYATTRASEISRGRSLVKVLISPAVPLAMYCRIVPEQFRKGHRIGRVASASPTLFFVLSAWAFGEAQGYLRRALRGRQ